MLGRWSAFLLPLLARDANSISSQLAGEFLECAPVGSYGRPYLLLSHLHVLTGLVPSRYQSDLSVMSSTYGLMTGVSPHPSTSKRTLSMGIIGLIQFRGRFCGCVRACEACVYINRRFDISPVVIISFALAHSKLTSCNNVSCPSANCGFI